ncbi:ImmA/IrrE family metallo-endopeptidase [Poritiphilus flavus]|uniref:HTH cro/C1-type domain-containing protein n=1 Tax=Poritiphilus flavus TaxID=2697053 RepID=A0A6L9EG15_9FLAO|nr:hypothetical protein [Poritiphilus flavus]NAS13720.1 hypothetical protein [Poritiphilus flavus]
MEKLDITRLLDKSFSEDYEPVDLLKLFEKKSKEYGFSTTHARELLGIERKSLMPILEGTAKQPNLINVLKIADYLEIDFNVMLASLVAKQSPENVQKLTEARKASFVAKNFDVDRLYSEGFLTTKTDTNTIIDRILTFFGFETLADYENLIDRVSLAVFSKSKRSFVDKMRHFSVNAAFHIFETIDNPNEYHREALLDLMPKIKPYCQDVENGLFIVCKALYNHGVTVIFQNHLTTSQLRGATFFVKDKPCIVLTDLFKRYPTIWWALLHELYHVLFDEEDVKKSGYHLSGEDQITLIDEEAPNEFASDYFVDKAELNFIRPRIFEEYLVRNFAKKIKVHPSFIYAKFQHHMKEVEGKDFYGAFRTEFPDYKKAVARLNPISWKEDYSIPAIAKRLKEIFDLKEEYGKKE